MDSDTTKKKGLPTLIAIKVHPKMDINELSYLILEVPGVENVYQVTGEYDLFAVVRASTSSELSILIKDIRQLNGVQSTTSFLVLQEFEKHGGMQISLKDKFSDHRR